MTLIVRDAGLVLVSCTTTLIMAATCLIRKANVEREEQKERPV